jgi:DNA-3-methyladenine glycosylase
MHRLIASIQGVISMTIDLNNYVDVEPDFFADAATEGAPKAIGCVVVFSDLRIAADSGILIAETEAYDETDMASHCHPGAAAQRRNRSASMLLPHGHVYIHEDRGMPCLNLVCGAEGFGSAILIRAGVPVIGIETMAERRSAHPSADRTIRARAPGFERKLCNGPCKVGEAIGLYPLLDGASLFKPPFRVLRPITPVTSLLNGPRINISKDADRPWRWGHPEHREWLSAPFPSAMVA